MSSRYDQLKAEALASCRARGHKILRIHELRYGYSSPTNRRGAAKCSVCAAWVQVTDHPAPNETEVGGPAVATNCPTDGRWI